MSSLFEVAQASTMAIRVDHLLYVLLAIAACFSLGIALAVVAFCIRYRARPDGRRAHPGRKLQMPIEITWIAIPFVLCLGLFFWGASVYVQGATFPADAEDILVVGKQWMWKLQHPGGQREINELHVPLGRNIRLVMTSEDVIHSFFVPEFRSKMDVLPGRYTFLWFNATEVGTFHLLCAQFCGTEHSRMRGKVIVMDPGDYARWLDAQPVTKSPAAAGADLFVNRGCVACHKSEDANRAPALERIYGTNVILQDGRTVLADENYLRAHIVDPGAWLVAGYQPIMPSFRTSLSDEEVFALVQYIKSLGQAEIEPGGNGLLDGDEP